jgi:hypothetical protein
MALLAALATAGGTVFSSCGWADIRHNIIAGTETFIRGYTADLWDALLPSAEDLVNLGAED